MFKVGQYVRIRSSGLKLKLIEIIPPEDKWQEMYCGIDESGTRWWAGEEILEAENHDD